MSVPGDKQLLTSDPKYRRYASLVDKTLASFEGIQEWADFITFVAKLLKVRHPAPSTGGAGADLKRECSAFKGTRSL